MARKTYTEEAQEYEREHGLSAESSVRGIHSKGRLTRGNIKDVIQFSVEQGDEPTCAYVTTAKACVYNVLGLGMDTTLTPEEKKQLDNITHYFRLSTEGPAVERDLNRILIEPDRCSPRGYTLIVLFFYFYDWLKKNHILGFFKNGARIDLVDDKNRPFLLKKKALFDFLKLTTKRPGGLQFTSAGWVNGITTALEEAVQDITWKMISVCTLQTRWSSDAPTFTPEQFQTFCSPGGIIFEITKKFKIMLTLKGSGAAIPLHDVLLVGIESGNLIISNTWGKTFDLVPIATLPLVELTLGSAITQWHAFQFTFLLPSIPGFEHSFTELKDQYYADDLQELIDGMDPYLTEMNAHKFPEIITDELLAKLARDKSASIGGKRQTKRRRSKRYTRLRQ